MNAAAPNFRLTVCFDGDSPEQTTLREFLADNEGAPEICAEVSKLEPGQQAVFGGGAAPLCTVRRAPKVEARFTRVRVPIQRYDGAEFVTLLIDRKRLTIGIRPARRRVALELELGTWARAMLEKQAKLNVNAKRKTRRTRRQS